MNNWSQWLAARSCPKTTPNNQPIKTKPNPKPSSKKEKKTEIIFAWLQKFLVSAKVTPEI